MHHTLKRCSFYGTYTFIAVRYEVFSAVTIKIAVFWDAPSCSLPERYHRNQAIHSRWQESFYRCVSKSPPLDPTLNLLISAIPSSSTSLLRCNISSPPTRSHSSGAFSLDFPMKIYVPVVFLLCGICQAYLDLIFRGQTDSFWRNQ
jgi:hypothetical protein